MDLIFWREVLEQGICAAASVLGPAGSAAAPQGANGRSWRIKSEAAEMRCYGWQLPLVLNKEEEGGDEEEEDDVGTRLEALCVPAV